MRFSKVLNVVGCHAEGEVGNVVIGGIGDVPGQTMLEKRDYLKQHRDDIRKLLLQEPRIGGLPGQHFEIGVQEGQQFFPGPVG